MKNRLSPLLLVSMATLLALLSSATQAQVEPAEPMKKAAKKISPTIDELLLFLPSKFPNGDWSPAGLDFEDVYFEAEDKTRLHGWFCPCENPRAVVLMSHGNAGHVASRAAWLRYLQNEAKLSVFLFDYRGYGRSQGHPSVLGALQDAKAARAKLREIASVKDSEMLLMGESLGGAIAIHLAADSAPRGLIVQSSFASYRSLADVHFPRLSWLVPRDKLASEAQIAKYHGPLLQSHGNRDRTVPFSSGEQLFRAANEPKRFVTIPNADHNNWLTDQYRRELNAFVTQVMGSH
jgi:uncharacterized protein